MMSALLFSPFRVTNVELINEKNPHILQFQNDMDCVILLRLLYLACFVVSTHVIFIYLMDYASSTRYLFTRLRKTFSSFEPKKNDHTQVYIIIMECFQCCLSTENSNSDSL